MAECFSLIFVLCFSMAKYILSGLIIFSMSDSYLSRVCHRCSINIEWIINGEKTHGFSILSDDFTAFLIIKTYFTTRIFRISTPFHWYDKICRYLRLNFAYGVFFLTYRKFNILYWQISGFLSHCYRSVILCLKDVSLSNSR